MAFSIIIEARFWDDPRFLSLKADLGEVRAVGSCVTSWRVGFSYWINGEARIPNKVWKMLRLPEELLKHNFAERLESGIYVRGTKEHCARYQKQCEKSEKGGIASAQSRRLKKSNNNNETVQPVVENGLNQNKNQVEPIPISIPTSNKREEKEMNLTVMELLEVWRETLSSFGRDSMPVESDIHMARILARYKNAEDVRNALIGQRFEKDNPPFMVADNLSLQRFLNRPQHFEKMSILGSAAKEKKWERASDAV